MFYAVILITFVSRLFIHNVIILCILNVDICGVIYLGIFIFTKKKLFFEIMNKFLMKLKLK